MKPAPHRIRSLRWQVDAASTGEAFSWRTLLHGQGTVLLLPVLQEGFDEAAADGRVIHLPKLELAIRLKSADKLETALPDMLLDQLREQLQRLLTADRSAGQTPPGEVATREGSSREMLLRYLQTGILPWQAAAFNSGEQAAILRDSCLDQWQQLVAHLQSAREEPPFFFRLLQLLPQEQAAELLPSFTAVMPHGSAAAVMDCLALLLGREGDRFSRFSRLRLLATILAESMAWRENPPHRPLLQAATAALPRHEQHLLEMFIAALPAPAAALFDSPHQEVLTPSRQHLHPVVYSEENDSPPQTAGPIQQARSLQQSENLFPLLVRQAGLILLHPWLVRFLDNCGIREAGGGGLPPSDLPRAAALLHFLATGREELHEYELGLVKVLLGLHPETPLLVCAGLLTSSDCEEAEVLLQSAVEYWSTLKNTSIDGLRSAFIERQGLLREEESGWKLNVERRPHDLLLDHLPWGIGIVKLSWMQKAIFSEW